MEKDATTFARVITAGLVIQLLVAAFVRQVSPATSVKKVARRVGEGRTFYLTIALPKTFSA